MASNENDTVTKTSNAEFLQNLRTEQDGHYTGAMTPAIDYGTGEGADYGAGGFMSYKPTIDLDIPTFTETSIPPAPVLDFGSDTSARQPQLSTIGTEYRTESTEKNDPGPNTIQRIRSNTSIEKKQETDRLEVGSFSGAPALATPNVEQLTATNLPSPNQDVEADHLPNDHMMDSGQHAAQNMSPVSDPARTMPQHNHTNDSHMSTEYSHVPPRKDPNAVTTQMPSQNSENALQNNENIPHVPHASAINDANGLQMPPPQYDANPRMPPQNYANVQHMPPQNYANAPQMPPQNYANAPQMPPQNYANAPQMPPQNYVNAPQMPPQNYVNTPQMPPPENLQHPPAVPMGQMMTVAKEMLKDPNYLANMQAQQITHMHTMADAANIAAANVVMPSFPPRIQSVITGPEGQRVKRKWKGVYSKEMATFESMSSLQSFLNHHNVSPLMIVKVEGTHTERRTRTVTDSQGHSHQETYYVTITDFVYEEKICEPVLPRQSVFLKDDGEDVGFMPKEPGDNFSPGAMGEMKSFLADPGQHKILAVTKRVQMDEEYLESKIEQLIRTHASYHGKITTKIFPADHQVHVMHPKYKNYWFNNEAFKFSCLLSFLWILWLPAKFTWNAFHVHRYDLTSPYAIDRGHLDTWSKRKLPEMIQTAISRSKKKLHYT